MSWAASLVNVGRVVEDLEYGAPRHVGRIVRILAYNFLARKDSRLTIDFYAHLKLNPDVQWEKQHYTSRRLCSPAN
jgi:hypothetical protein